MNAEEYWLSNTEECPNLPNRKKARHDEEIVRKKYGAIAWLRWDQANQEVWLVKLERPPAYPKGDGAKLLGFICLICKKFNYKLRGNIVRYDPYGSIEYTASDHKKLAEWYEGNGVSVYQCNYGRWHINYAPN